MGATMNRKGFLILAVILLVGSFSWAGMLSVMITPQKPVLIPVGSGTVLDGQPLEAPYFLANSVHVSWTGPEKITLLLLELKADDNSYTCAYSGDQLSRIFPNNVDASNHVVIDPKVDLIVTSQEFGCAKVSIPSPIPDSVNIPFTAKLTAISSQVVTASTSFSIGY